MKSSPSSTAPVKSKPKVSAPSAHNASTSHFFEPSAPNPSAPSAPHPFAPDASAPNASAPTASAPHPFATPLVLKRPPQMDELKAFHEYVESKYGQEPNEDDEAMEDPLFNEEAMGKYFRDLEEESELKKRDVEL
jgi:hypothetical protein